MDFLGNILSGQDLVNKDYVDKAIPVVPTKLSELTNDLGLGSLAYKSSLVASDIPDLSSKYLPLSGGTITGTLTLSKEGSDIFVINRLSTSSPTTITYRKNGSLLGRMGFNTDGAPVAQVSGTYQTLLHSGNYSSYALPLSGGTIAGNGTGLLAINRKDGNPVIEFHHNGSLMGRYGFATDGTPIGVVAGSQVTLIHSGNVGEYNAGSATKLADDTAFVAWGQPFFQNGKPRDVDGSLVITNGTLTLTKGQMFRFHNATDNTFIEAISFRGDSFHIGYGNAGLYDTYIQGNNIVFRPGKSRSEAMRINSSGNVTIGGSDLAGTSAKLYVDGKARVSDELIVTNPTGIRWAYGDYGTLFRNDGQDFYILFTDSGGALTGSWNSLRPFRISLTTGDVTMEHNLTVVGAIKSSSIICATSRLRVNSPTNGGVFGYMDAQLFGTTTNVSSVHIGSCYGGSSSLDNTAEYPSGVSMTAISIYRGRVGIGKRWSDTELRALHDANCSLGVLNNAHIMGNLAVSSIYSDNGQSGVAGVVLRNEGGIEISHASTPYIDFHFANSTSDFNHRFIARANNIFAYSGNYFCPWGSESLGASSYRWQYVYAKAGSFSNDMEINGALTVGAGATFNGDVRINGNLVVTGDTASGGTGQETTSTSQLLVINQSIPTGSSVSQSALDAIGLTSDVIDDLLDGKYHHVLEVIGSNKSLYTTSGYNISGTKLIILQVGSTEADAASWYTLEQYNGGNWNIYFREI